MPPQQLVSLRRRIRDRAFRQTYLVNPAFRAHCREKIVEAAVNGTLPTHWRGSPLIVHLVQRPVLTLYLEHKDRLFWICGTQLAPSNRWCINE